MLEQFMVNGYRIDTYKNLNDRLQYIDYVDRHYEYKSVAISPIDAYRYQGNLFGVFSILNIAPSLYIYAMYLNGYTNPSNYSGHNCTFKVPVMPPVPS